MGLVEELREHRRLARMRLGQEAPEFVDVKSAPGIRYALVPLTEAEYEQGLMSAATMAIDDNSYGIEVRDRWLQANNLYHALRDPSNVEKKVFESPEQMVKELEAIDINHFADMYQRMVEDSSPALDGLTDETLEELKKALEQIDWSVLSGKPWWHLRNFFLTLTPAQLTVNSFGSSLTKKLIGKSESPESTPIVLENSKAE